MLTEKELLKDIISQAPLGTIWEFTYSWDQVEDVFRGHGNFNHTNKTFSVILNQDNKSFFIQMMMDYNIADWIVHQYVRRSLGEIIFESYDNMTFSMISPDFPKCEVLLTKYSGTDLLELMQRSS